MASRFRALLLLGCLLLCGLIFSPNAQAQDDVVTPSITFSPQAGPVSTPQVSLTITWTDDQQLSPTTRHIWLNGQEVTPLFTYSGSATSATSTGTITLVQGAANTVEATICDTSFNCALDPYPSATYTYVPPAPAVSVSPDGATGIAYTNKTSVTQQFTVANGGVSADTYTLAVSCAGASVNCSVPSPITIAAGSSASVNVTYSTTSRGGPARIQLVATHQESTVPTDTGWVELSVLGAANYSVSVTPDAGVASIGVGGTATLPFKVANLGINGQTGGNYNLSVQCTGPITCSSVPASQWIAGGQWVPVPVTYTAGATAGTGRIRLLAVSALNGVTPLDSGWVSVNVQAGGTVAPQVSVADLNPRGTQDRGGCMRISLAVAESECGDLVMGHALPGLRVLNRLRAPSLVYSSQTAHPRPVVRANVTIPAGSAVPSSVTATLKVNGGTVATASWPGTSFPVGTPKRIALGFDALSGYATGLYPYSVEVSAAYAGGVTQTTAVFDTMAIVNRAASPFGAGWWVSGMEQVMPVGPGILWIGGDGSTRLYRNSGVVGRWLADDSNGTDAIVLADNSYFARKLVEGGEIRFSMSGYETAAVNRLGMVTTFARDAGRNLLTNISLPSGNAFTPPYTGWTFSYGTAGLLDSVSVEGVTAGSRRTVKVGRSGAGDVTSFTDPDNLAEGFAYAGAAHVVTGTTLYGRSGTAASQSAFGWDASGRVSSVRRYGGGMTSNAQDVVLTITNPETQGWAGTVPQDTSAAYGVVDGPRTDVADVSLFWTGRYGEPRQLQDPLGNQTYLYRRDANFPDQVTMVDQPGGGSTPGQYTTRAVSLAYFDDLGRLIRTELRNPFGDGQLSETDYFYTDPRWPFSPTMTTSPDAITTYRGYDVQGNLAWQQVGSDSLRRVHYLYNAVGQVDSLWSAAARGRGERPQRIAYDPVLRNLASTTSPLGRTTTYATDRIGRDTLVSSPIDGSAGRFTLQTTSYDVAGRVLSSTTSASNQSVSVATGYDDIGRAASTTRTMSPDTNHIGAMTITYQYDALGRTIREIAPDNRSDSVEYNPAGQAITTVTRRSSQFGPTNIVMTYDAAGHLLTRITPSFAYPTKHLADFGRAWEFPNQPLNPDNPSNPNVIAGDTAVFTYDGAGHVLTANNHDAQITRTYLPGGALGSETQAIRSYTGADFSQHVYTVSYRYSREGRRTVLKHPANLRPAPGQDSVTYGYDRITGELTSVTDPMGNVFGFRYDMDGRLTQRTIPGGITEASGFDADGRLTVRNLYQAEQGLLVDSLTYDDRDKVTAAGGTNRATAIYTGMGALNKWNDLDPEHYENTTKVIDPLGNLQWEDRRWVNIDAAYGKMHTQQSYRYAQGTGRQLSMQEYSTLDGSITDQDSWSYDAAGNRDWHSGSHMGSSDSYGSRLMQERMQSYYGADDRLRVADRQRCLTSVLPTNPGSSATVICGTWNETLGQDPSAFEEYRYDALGRRVLVRRRLYEVNGLCTSVYHTCNNAIERYVYDGDQLLWEIRTPTSANATATELESDAGTGDFGGRVGYTHGAGIDAPLDLIRIGHDAGLMTIIPHANWRGMYATGTLADGTTSQGMFNLAQIAWPGPNADAWHNPIAPGQPSNWFGSLIADQRDASGLMHRRNRQYDPATGRFTQEDPIGIAGGLNLYGFGGGDALNYTDPYGLCTAGDTIPANQCSVDPNTPENRQLAQGYRMAGDHMDEAMFSPVDAAFIAGDAAFATVRVAGKEAIALATRRGFRAALMRATGVAAHEVADYDAHHVFPYVFRKQFAEMGIDVGDSRFGAWWERSVHQRMSRAYQREWERFLASDATREGAIQFARDLARKYSFTIHF